ncbi:uncharacterized protein isoform X2 [Danio rerio]|uniref:Uncharacterized protein isoform X2 n=1 Tax=Danio rerio TaxID=7955 RepID=A0AC58I634_DANRE
MSLVYLSLSALEALMEPLELELEAVECQTHDLEMKLWEQQPRAAAHSSEVSVRYNLNTTSTSTPWVSLSRPSAQRARFAQVTFTPTPGYHGPWVQPCKVLTSSRGSASPPPVFGISTKKRFTPLRETVAMWLSSVTPSFATSALLPTKLESFLGES